MKKAISDWRITSSGTLLNCILLMNNMSTFYRRKLFRYRSEPMYKFYARRLREWLYVAFWYALTFGLALLCVWEVVQGL